MTREEFVAKMEEIDIMAHKKNPNITEAQQKAWDDCVAILLEFIDEGMPPELAMQVFAQTANEEIDKRNKKREIN